MLGFVPASALNEHPVDVAAVIGFLFDVCVGDAVQVFELEAQLVDGDDVLSRVVLERSC